ncbi:hypothetical protein B0H13DRAFT_2323867 [Mycena leptocephala]|nr:hypothetical protein B0H13DRAFT_2323867 [Mycena leptocephala]
MALSPRPTTTLQLWDYAIDNVVNPDDSCCYLNLRTCSLVCRAFTHRAQAHLFCEIEFWRPWASDHSVDAQNRTLYVHVPYDYIGGGGRLCTVLRSSPHLIPFIQRIDRPNYKGDIQDDAATSLLAELIAMPSVCEVRVNDSHSTVINLSHLFRAPSSAVIFLHISFLDSPQNNPRAGAWLAHMHPDCPFDLSRLVVADIAESMSAELVMTPWDVHTIKHLRIDTDAAIENLDLSRFPALECLEIKCLRPDNLAHIVPIISAASTNNLEELSLEIGVLIGDSQELTQDFDNIITLPHMPGLRIVTMMVEEYQSMTPHKAITEAEEEEILRSFPKLRRGRFVPSTS